MSHMIALSYSLHLTLHLSLYVSISSFIPQKKQIRRLGQRVDKEGCKINKNAIENMNLSKNTWLIITVEKTEN